MAETNGKLHALLVGGKQQNLTDFIRAAMDYIHIEQDSRRFPSVLPDGTQMVVVFTKFSDSDTIAWARKFAKANGVPCVFSKTCNQLPNELRRHGFLVPEALPPEPAAAVSESEPPAPDFGPDSTGPNAAWRSAVKGAVMAIQSLLKPKEAFKEEALFDLLCAPGMSGMEKEDLRTFLPELFLRGVLIKTPDGKLMYPGNGDHYDNPYAGAFVLGKRADDGATHLDTLARLCAGLPVGPYEAKCRLLGAMEGYPQFRQLRGKALTNCYVTNIVNRAIELGAIKATDRGFEVVHDPKVASELQKRRTHVPPVSVFDATTERMNTVSDAPDDSGSGTEDDAPAKEVRRRTGDNTIRAPLHEDPDCAERRDLIAEMLYKTYWPLKKIAREVCVTMYTLLYDIRVLKAKGVIPPGDIQKIRPTQTGGGLYLFPGLKDLRYAWNITDDADHCDFAKVVRAAHDGPIYVPYYERTKMWTIQDSVPKAQWDRWAAETIADETGGGMKSEYSSMQGLFLLREWNGLAWAKVKTLPKAEVQKHTKE